MPGSATQVQVVFALLCILVVLHPFLTKDSKSITPSCKGMDLSIKGRPDTRGLAYMLSEAYKIKLMSASTSALCLFHLSCCVEV